MEKEGGMGYDWESIEERSWQEVPTTRALKMQRTFAKCIHSHICIYVCTHMHTCMSNAVELLYNEGRRGHNGQAIDK